MSRLRSPAPAFLNERNFPHIVEMRTPQDGFSVQLSREMMAFHQSRGIQPHYGWPKKRDGHCYCRWCFAHAAIADVFLKRFGGKRHDVELARFRKRSTLSAQNRTLKLPAALVPVQKSGRTLT